MAGEDGGDNNSARISVDCIGLDDNARSVLLRFRASGRFEIDPTNFELSVHLGPLRLGIESVLQGYIPFRQGLLIRTIIRFLLIRL